MKIITSDDLWVSADYEIHLGIDQDNDDFPLTPFEHGIEIYQGEEKPIRVNYHLDEITIKQAEELIAGLTRAVELAQESKTGAVNAGF